MNKENPAGFRDRILARHVYNTAKLEAYNLNYVGGDINAGAIDTTQLFTCPVLGSSPYRKRNLYLFCIDAIG
jgi:phytoene dehydrogenase-like protein